MIAGTRTVWQRWRGPLVILGAAGLVALIGVFDFRTGPDLVFSISYMLPVLWAARSGPRGAGFLTAFLSSVSMLVADHYGDRVVVAWSVSAWNLFSRFALLAVAAVLVRSLRSQLALAHEHARTDALTGLISRGRFLELLEGEVRRTRRYGHPLSLAYVDVDDFKQVNDTHGHTGGDRLLRAIATALREETRSIDVAGRVGGDEFMLLMPETEANDARVLVERLQGALRDRGGVENALRGRAGGAEGALPACGGDPVAPVTFSIGVLTFLRVPESTDQAVQQVDDLMYEVKRGGKDGFLHRVVD